MTKEQEYEILKTHLIDVYGGYIDLLEQSSFADLKDIDKRMALLDAYVKTIHSNTAFREFINHKVNYFETDMNMDVNKVRAAEHHEI